MFNVRPNQKFQQKRVIFDEINLPLKGKIFVHFGGTQGSTLILAVMVSVKFSGVWCTQQSNK